MATVTSNAQVDNAALLAQLNNRVNGKASSADEINDRFLKLLVAQMNNQDPLNPLDNAQVTTQMAQISTVTGINNMSDTVGQLMAQFASLQALQAAQLTGHSVMVDDDHFDFAGAGSPATIGVDLPASADKVTVEIRDANGAAVRTLQLGAGAAGIRRVDWDGAMDDGRNAPAGSYSFTVKATSGATELPAVPLVAHRVEAVGQYDGAMRLMLQGGGSVAYEDVRQFL